LPLYTARMHCSKHQSPGRTFEMRPLVSSLHCMRSSKWLLYHGILYSSN